MHITKIPGLVAESALSVAIRRAVQPLVGDRAAVKVLSGFLRLHAAGLQEQHVAACVGEFQRD